MRSKPAASKKTPTAQVPFEPKHPGLVATACFSLWIAILSLPMLSGAFLASPYNDQYSSGYAYRAWGAEWWRKLGHVPLWNPDLFGGMPFIAGMHGDQLYPTALLRLVLPTHVAMNLGFVIHYVLAGVFTYWFLRRWRVSWTGAVVGGLAYQLSGVIGSYVSPGHDGKLFVTAMLPLLLVGLTLGVRDRRLEGYAIGALAVGLIMLSPHPQMAEFALLAAGLFTLYLVFGDGAVTAPRDRVIALGLALAAVIVGVGIAAAQYMPFYAYIAYSPRAASVLNDFAWSAAYGIPWSHVPEFVIPRFTGETFSGTYWGPNGLKLHSEYLGLVAVALAVVGAMDRGRRRMVLWLLAIAAVFLLIGLSDSTPFFRLWWEFVPFAKSTRAPGMALFIVSFVTATLAAFGTDRIARGEAPRFATVAMIVGGAVALLGVAGLFGAMTETFGERVEVTLGYPSQAAGVAAGAAVRWSSFAAGIALALAGLVIMLRGRNRLSTRAAPFALVAIVGTELWLNARPFWMYSRAPETLFGSDAVKARLHSIRPPFRVWDVDDAKQQIHSVYPGAALMADDISQLYGHQANEPHTFDVLTGRQGQGSYFERAGNPRILDLFAVNYLIVRAAAAPESIPGFKRTVSNVPTSSGVTATLFEREPQVPYARFIPAAATQPSLDQTVTAVLSPSFPVDRLVLLDSVGGALTPANPLPEAVKDPITIDEWVPGRMHVRLATAAPSAGYVLVSENWDTGWRATVDGRPVPVRRGDGTLITVPVSAGAQSIQLSYESAGYDRGRVIAIVSLLIVAIAMLAPPRLRKSRLSRSS